MAGYAYCVWFSVDYGPSHIILVIYISVGVVLLVAVIVQNY